MGGKFSPSWKKVVSALLAIMVFSIPVMAYAMQAQQAEDLQRQAIFDAQQQAERDANKWLWFGFGCLGSGLALLAAALIEPKPPQTALMGKSPEYVAAYTDEYTRRVKSIRTNHVLYGCIVSIALYAALYFLVIAAMIEETEDYYYYY